MWTRTTAASVLIGALLVTLALVPFLGTSTAAEKAEPDWSQLRIVTYSSGLTGFFDPQSGKLYVYDANVEQCFMIRQLDELGKPMKRVKN
ncbi:MAG TPA: hypothetical protein VMY37_08480 [Thermoguttaceae bacterium]|nr:hypothetical protein [Thermoguttaceae bacterium]